MMECVVVEYGRGRALTAEIFGKAIEKHGLCVEYVETSDAAALVFKYKGLAYALDEYKHLVARLWAEHGWGRNT